MTERIELELSPKQEEALRRAMQTAQEAKKYIFPWPGLEAHLEADMSGVLPLVGYGSLLNKGSAAMTISKGARVPVIAFGVRRIFNYEMSLPNPRYGAPADPLARAALNVKETGRRRDMTNAIMVEVPTADIPALRKREVGYDLLPVACIHWNQREHPPFIGYVLLAPDEPREGSVHTSSEIEPHRQYYGLCREGAAKISDDFLQFWLDSTYLADAVTPVREWETKAFGGTGVNP